VKLDLLVLAISAVQVPEVLNQVIKHEKAESVIVIPAGFEEKEGCREIARQMKAALASSRRLPWQGPIINGGNCVGLRSAPGHYDTIFIPDYKLPSLRANPSPLAIIAQSGAFTVARASCLWPHVNPRFLISVGNQTDLTISDYLDYLKDDHEIKVFAIYLEGFKEGDGERFLRTCKEITTSGRKVILYAAGRTALGSQAMASHTASIAGDYPVTKKLTHGAGALLVESSESFDGLIRLVLLWEGRPMGASRIGAISNAGFDCVAIADSLGKLSLAEFSETTKEALTGLFRTAKLDEILDIHNPLDVSPQAGDELYSQAARLIMEDPGVDLGVFANVPVTPALNTLPKGAGHQEDFLGSSGSWPQRLLKLKSETSKPFLAVVDGGPLYDPMCNFLVQGGVPVFRSIAQALDVVKVLAS